MTFVAGTVLTAAALNSELASKTDTAMTQNAQTGTTYSFALADASKLLTTSNASPVSVTVTKQATVTWVTGTQLRVINLGAGVTTLVADTGVTINGNVALKQYQGGTLIRTASDVWLFVPTASSSGMDLITPTSVAGSGVTLSGGEISFSASTIISVNGVFTATYDNYRMVWESSLAAGEQALGIRMRLAGTDNTSANYTSQYFFADAAATGQARQTGQTSHLTTNVSVNRTFGVTEIGSPALAQRTAFMTNSTVDASTPTTRFYTGAQTQATAFDGISLIPSASSMTGKLRIYGLRKS